jgi:hypothetical protein
MEPKVKSRDTRLVGTGRGLCGGVVDKGRPLMRGNDFLTTAEVLWILKAKPIGPVTFG